MDDAKKLTEIVNQSGFPLQIGIRNLVERTKNVHGWRVLHSEHSWRNPEDGDTGFIDLVLENKYGTSLLIVECKRVLESSWIFLLPDPRQASRRHAKCWITRCSNKSATHFAWKDIPIDPSTPESEFCVVPGQDAKSRPMLERVASELVSATEGFAWEEAPVEEQKLDSLRMYFSVIVTTAKLKTCAFSPDEISLKDGKVADAQYTDTPSIRFRKQLTALSPKPSDPARAPRGFGVIQAKKEHTVFVVHAEAFVEFLQNHEVDNSGLVGL